MRALRVRVWRSIRYLKILISTNWSLLDLTCQCKVAIRPLARHMTGTSRALSGFCYLFRKHKRLPYGASKQVRSTTPYTSVMSWSKVLMKFRCTCSVRVESGRCRAIYLCRTVMTGVSSPWRALSRSRRKPTFWNSRRCRSTINKCLECSKLLQNSSEVLTNARRRSFRPALSRTYYLSTSSWRCLKSKPRYSKIILTISCRHSRPSWSR